MKTATGSKLDLYEQSQITFHKVFIACMLIGLVWVFFTWFGPSAIRHMAPAGAALFGIPRLVSPLRFNEEYKATRNKVNTMMILFVVLLFGTIFSMGTVFPNLPGYVFVVVSLIGFVLLAVWSRRQWKGIKAALEEERLSMIAQKAQTVFYNVFIGQVLLVLCLLYLFQLQPTRDVCMLFFLIAMFISSGSMSVAFLIYYREN